MKRPESHQIDELAQRIFRASLPPTWVVNDHTCDYGKDYTVEISENDGELTGTSFYVQLKGQRNVRFSNDKKSAKFSLESKHSRYYANRVHDLPVFLVVVDVTTKQGWWLFLQRVLKRDLRWKKNRSMMLDIPVSNQLNQPVLLREAVEKSARWVRSQHPTALPDAMGAYRESLTELDHRFEYKVTSDGVSTMIYINPVEKPVKMRMVLKGDSTVINKKMHDLVGRGLRVKFDPGELTINGSKLFEDVHDHGVEIQAEFRHNAILNLILYNSSNTELSRLNGIPVVLRGGHTEMRFEGRLGSSPLYVAGGPLATNEFGKLNLSFKFEQWNGYPILTLPFFDQLLPFLAELENAKQLGFELFVEGNKIISITSNETALESFTIISKVAQIISKTRDIFQKVGENPKWDHSHLDQKFFEVVDCVHALLSGRRFTELRRNEQFSMNLNRQTFNPELIPVSGVPVLLSLVSTMTAEILGCKIELGKVHQEYANVLITLASKKRRIKGKGSNSVSVCVTGTETTVYTLYKGSTDDKDESNKAQFKKEKQLSTVSEDREDL